MKLGSDSLTTDGFSTMEDPCNATSMKFSTCIIHVYFCELNLV